MELLSVDTMDEARAKLIKYCGEEIVRTESAALERSLGRVLAEDICAEENIPPYRRSTMDGYAVRSSDLGAAGDMIPTILRISGEVLMGSADITGNRITQLQDRSADNIPHGSSCVDVTSGGNMPDGSSCVDVTSGGNMPDGSSCMDVTSGGNMPDGCCVYVPTGGWVPDGADAVVMTEYCEAFGNDMLAVSKSIAPGENVVQIGEDVRKGDAVLHRGRRLRPQDAGVLAAMGITSVRVYTPWRVSIISTGDELIPPSDNPLQGQMRDINSYTIAARSVEEGFNVIRTMLIRDDESALIDALEAARTDSDVVIISGGSSQGKKDMTAEIIGRIADSGVLTHGIAAKPGKPTITGCDSSTGTLFIGLPGHPAAALIIFEELLIGLWRTLTGQSGRLAIQARISMNVPSSPGRRTYQLVRIAQIAELSPSGPTSGQTGLKQGSDAPELRPNIIEDQSTNAGEGCREATAAIPIFARSGMISPLSASDGYFEMSENQEGVRAGETVTVYLWS